MSLSIVLTRNGKVPEWNEETSISFDDESADYWYLWPTLITDIKNKTGELIDLYDDAEFVGKNLDKIESVLSIFLIKLKSINEVKWNVHTGAETHPDKREIFHVLIKKDLQDKLEKFLKIIHLAIEQGEMIICIGD